MKHQAQQSDQRLDQNITIQQIGDAGRASRDEPGAERKAAHIEREDECLGIRGMSQEQLQVMRPDGFIDQSGEA